jgi:nucleotide-binding universal stress UspA family protein
MAQPYRRVVVGTDGSQTASAAVRQAAELAGATGAELVIVTAYVPENESPDPKGEAPEEIAWRLTDVGTAEEHADGARQLAHEAGAKKVRVRAEQGEAADILIQVAEDTGADCIVVGSRGMASTRRFILGSVPNRVSHHAPCDVLIVHTTS